MTDRLFLLHYTFGYPVQTPGAISTKMRDAVSRTDLRPCTAFQPNPFSSFVDASQTNSKLSIPHNNVEAYNNKTSK